MDAIQQIKQGARKTWAEGEYLALSQFLPPASAHLVRAAGIKTGDKVLDVACGTGVTAITAARAGAKVSALDLTPDLLAVAEDEAALANVMDIQWREGDAEAMPYDDAAFDVVMSSFGHMFTPDPASAASELLRVTKPGGTIAFTTWPPESAVGQMFKVMGAILPPPPGSAAPAQWGVPEIVGERLGDAVTDIRFERGTVSWPMLSAGHLWALFRDSYGPFVMAMAKLEGEPEKQQQLAVSVQSIFENFFHDNVVTFDYLLTHAKKV
jgi:SAM-dependent methyltransferase